MDLNGSNRNGGSKKDSIVIIIMWKMKRDAGTGYSGWGIMMMLLTGGLCMGSLHDAPQSSLEVRALYSPPKGGVRIPGNDPKPPLGGLGA